MELRRKRDLYRTSSVYWTRSIMEYYKNKSHAYISHRKFWRIGSQQITHETAIHVLWSYPFARNVWALSRGRVQKCSNEADDFFLLFKHMQCILDGADLDQWAVTAWCIWNARNKYYFEHFQQKPRFNIERATALLTEYHTFIIHGSTAGVRSHIP